MRLALVDAAAWRRPEAGARELEADELLAEYVTEIRWWTQAELGAADTLFAPRRLPELVAALVRDGPPREPLDVGV